MTRPSSTRHAVTDDVPVEEMTREQLRDAEREWGTAEALIPQSVEQTLRKAFTLRGMPFFEFYIKLRRTRLGEPVEENLRREYRRVAARIGMIRSPVDGRTLSPTTVAKIALVQPLMERLLGALGQPGHEEDPVLWGRLNMVFIPTIVDVARDKGVYLRPTRQTGRERWAVFVKMTAGQERVERLRDEDPESYALTQQMGQALEIIDLGIEDRIRAEGKTVERTYLAGRPVMLGTDPTKDEDDEDKTVVYDRDGDVLSKDDFFAKRRAAGSARALLENGSFRTGTPPAEMRRVGPDRLDRLEGDVRWHAITDDKAKQGRLTRIFPTKEMPVFVSDPDKGTRTERQKVVVAGRHKGVFLDDMVNDAGRLVEGTAYAYEPKRGRSWTVPRRIDPSEREPYVTVAEITEQTRFGRKKIDVVRKKLYVKIDGSRKNKPARDALKTLACNTGTRRGCISTVSFHPVEGSNAAGFYFEPKDFGIVMQSLPGLVLSEAALETVENHYRDLSRAESATATANLGAYAPKALSSETDEGESFRFVTATTDPHTGTRREFALLKKQLEAVAWLDANEESGVCALDAGIGKTLCCIATMLKLVRDGKTGPDADYERPDGQIVTTNGRFLYVCTPSLKGNLPKEIRTFISDPKALLARSDVVSYAEFSGSSKSKKVPKSLSGVPFWKNRSWNPALYVAVFFDEAQELADFESEPSKAALKLWHPRKICLTASPMENHPMEAYVLGAVSNNTPLFGKSREAVENRQEMRRFKERFCEVVGGRIVGVVRDPMVMRDLHTWIKRNIFYADKTEVDEHKLPTPVTSTVAVPMPFGAEQVYRDVASRFAIVLRGAARKFSERTHGDSYADKEAEKLFGLALRPVVKLLTDLSNRPAKALNDIAAVLETRRSSPSGEPSEFPRALESLYRTWSETASPEQFRESASRVGNPKLETTARAITTRLERTEGSRVLLFSDDRDFCTESGMHLAKTVAGTHVVATDKSIRFFRAGQELTEWFCPLDKNLVMSLVTDPIEQDRLSTEGRVRFPLPFRPRKYRRYPVLPESPDNVQYERGTWQQFVLKEIIGPNPTIVSCTLYGKTYMYGHNLQMFDTVIHLDRNSWNSESMKQRTARAWRQGQKQVVEEITIDATYPASDDEWDVSLDVVREAFQKMNSDLFDAIIKAAQGTLLGEEWDAVSKRDASLWKLDRKVAELFTSPYVGRSKPPGSR